MAAQSSSSPEVQPAPLVSIPFKKLRQVHAAAEACNEQQQQQQEEQSGRSIRKYWIVGTSILLAIVILCLSISLPLVLKRTNKEFTVSNACKSTRYPDVCLASLASSHSAKSGPREMLEEATRAAMHGVEKMLNLTIEYKRMDGHSVKVKAAFRDCMELLGSSIEQLEASLEDIIQGDYKEDISDIQTWMSAALTYQDTCMDELEEQKSGNEEVDHLKKVGQGVQKLLSNALALVNPLASAWRSSFSAGTKHLLVHHGWIIPERNLLGGIPHIDAIVAQDGSGHYGRIQDALDAAPRMSPRRYVIHIRAGVYREYVNVKIYQTNIVFIGDGQGKTIITGSRNVLQPGVTTRTSATVGIEGRGFMARDLTIENTAGLYAQQAVALRVGADQAAFWRCSIHGYQDTLLAYVFRQFYRDCTVSGTVDFVFGNAAAVFQNCTFQSRVPIHGQQTVVTAQGRADPAQNTGFSFHMCTVGGAWPVYLGRPWKEYARVVWLRSKLGAMVPPTGWLPWEGTQFGLRTSYFAEYMNWGPGAALRRRANWVKVIRRSRVARRFTPVNFIAANSWLPRSSINLDQKL